MGWRQQVVILNVTNHKLFVKRHSCCGPPNNDNCAGPYIATTSWQYNHSAPVTVRKTASKQHVVWTINKNLHAFLRLAKVLVQQRNSFIASEKHDYHSTCFKTGVCKCNSARYISRTGEQLYKMKLKVSRMKNELNVLVWLYYKVLQQIRKIWTTFLQYHYSHAYVRIKARKSLLEFRS